MTKEILAKIDEWVEEDLARMKQAATDLNLGEIKDSALAGRRSGYWSAMQNIFENPEKFGFAPISELNRVKKIIEVDYKVEARASYLTGSNQNYTEEEVTSLVNNDWIELKKEYNL